jgi:hypothetical protein
MTWDRSQLEAILAPPDSPERQLVAADLALEHGEELTSLALRIAAHHHEQLLCPQGGQSVFLRLPGDQNHLIWIFAGAMVCVSWRHLSHSAYFSSLRGQWMNDRGSTNIPWLTDTLKDGVLQHLRQFHQGLERAIS